MIEPEQLYNVNFYQKEKFYGSYKGMHYRIEKYEQPLETANADVPPGEAESSSRPETKTVFRVFTWPGPYIFSVTPDEKKETACFEFTNEALKEICTYLNKKWESSYQ